MTAKSSIQTISVIVPANPFVRPELQEVRHCLAALDVEKLLEWWPGTPHTPHRNPAKVRAIQRSLDWKRVASIAAYLLQREIIDAPDRLDSCFRKVYEPRASEPGREWPPKVPQVVGYQRSEYPTFSNVLLHVNGANIRPLPSTQDGAAKLVFDENDPNLNFSVIDGQHRINGAYFAVRILTEEKPDDVNWEIPVEVFLDLDKRDDPPRRQAQIFIDVNFNQKKVDRSLVADLFPTARGPRGPLDDKERAQDLGRKLMLEIGPLVGMIQIPGIKFGMKDVISLATLNSAVEDIIGNMYRVDIKSLEAQAEFLAQCLDAWFEATGRKEGVNQSQTLDATNVAYQGRAIDSFLRLVPACIWKLKKAKVTLISDDAKRVLSKWLHEVLGKAGLLQNGRLLAKAEFKKEGFLGSGGLARLRDALWASAIGAVEIGKLKPEEIAELAEKHHGRVLAELAGYE
jgi:DGQHR domain-containing protein